MKYAHNIKVSVFCKQEDNEADILKNLLALFPFNLEEQKVKVNRSNAEGFQQRKIVIYEITLEKDRHINEFINHLLSSLNDEQKQLLIRQLDSRIDNDLNFFLRLDKDKLIKEGKYFITEYGNCYHIKMSVAAFPSKKEMALEVIRNMLNS